MSVFGFLPGGFVFAKPMREKKYVTMMDPFQIKYGKSVAALMAIPAIVVDVFWVACTLMALGNLFHIAVNKINIHIFYNKIAQN